VVGLRHGERVLSPRDQRVIDLVTSSVAVAVQESLNAAALQSAREALVSAREEERRRLGRDLHDGLGPVLTAVTLKADAARRLVTTDPARAIELLEDLGQQTTAGVQEIRRLAHKPRPPVLDSLGLLGALEQHANTLGTLDVRVSGEVTAVPAAVEVAAYRIASEALTNVVRHSSATEVTVDLSQAEHRLRLVVQDNGRAANGAWVSGVGLSSMRERAGELGGTVVAGPHDAGGRVEATLPWEGAL
jgi:signal transduction histidine kinase